MLATFYNGFSVVRGDIIICVVRKLVFSIPDQVRHKPCCTATGDAQRRETLDAGSDGIVSIVSARLFLCFGYAKVRFSHDTAHISHVLI